jgi:hypothetical protein
VDDGIGVGVTTGLTVDSKTFRSIRIEFAKNFSVSWTETLRTQFPTAWKLTTFKLSIEHVLGVKDSKLNPAIA